MKSVQNIWCVGRNYVEHAKEFNNPVPKELLVFLKAGSCLKKLGETLFLPAFSHHIDAELEVALQLNDSLQINRACLALDLTARDLQTRAKEQGLPWTLAKSFIGACPISAFFPFEDLDESFCFELFVNGELKQRGDTKNMCFSFRSIVEYCTQRFPVCPGDLILTGTPAGVPRIEGGDRLIGRIEGKTQAEWNFERGVV